MDNLDFFKTFETFVPKRVDTRNQKMVDTLIALHSNMLSFLQSNPNFPAQVAKFHDMLKKYQDTCNDLTHDFKDSIKSLDLSKLKDFDEIMNFFAEEDDDVEYSGLKMFADIVVDSSDVRKIKALQKVSDGLSIFSDEETLYQILKTKIYNKENFVVKTKNYEVVIDFYKLIDWYATPAEKKALDAADLGYGYPEESYIIAKFLGLVDDEPSKFMMKVKKENPDLLRNLQKAYNRVIVNMKRGKKVESKYLDQKERKIEGLQKLDSRNYGITDILYFKK
jgi:hypothetical protein